MIKVFLVLFSFLLMCCTCSPSNSPVAPSPSVSDDVVETPAVVDESPTEPEPAVIVSDQLVGRTVSGPTWSMVLPYDFNDSVNSDVEFFSMSADGVGISVDVLEGELQSLNDVVHDTYFYLSMNFINYTVSGFTNINNVRYAYFETNKDKLDMVLFVTYAKSSSLAFSCGNYNMSDDQKVMCYNIMQTIQVH